jgi:hypothetical protein
VEWKYRQSGSSTRVLVDRIGCVDEGDDEDEEDGRQWLRQATSFSDSKSNLIDICVEKQGKW